MKWRIEVEIEADTTDDLALKLNDIAHSLLADRWSPKSVFGGASVSGMYEVKQVFK